MLKETEEHPSAAAEPNSMDIWLSSAVQEPEAWLQSAFINGTLYSPNSRVYFFGSGTLNTPTGL